MHLNIIKHDSWGQRVLIANLVGPNIPVKTVYAAFMQRFETSLGFSATETLQTVTTMELCGKYKAPFDVNHLKASIMLCFIEFLKQEYDFVDTQTEILEIQI